MIFPAWLEGLLRPEPPKSTEPVELTSTTQEAIIEDALQGYLGVEVTEGVVVQTIEVEAYVQQWVIGPDDIYLIKRDDDPPIWFTNYLLETIDGSPLADEVADLNERFDNFDNGVTLQIGYLQEADYSLAYDISVLKVSDSNQTAAIQNLDVVKVDSTTATAIAETVVAAWAASGDGGAWFDSKITAVSDAAYSAVTSASVLTATLDSQQDQLTTIAGDLEILASQVDGTVETWFNTHDVVDANGDIITTAEPYASWYDADPELDTRSIHTGDTYVKYELDANDNKVYLGSFRFTLTTVDEPYTDSDGYAWVQLSDSTADEAYVLALEALDLADSKIVTYYQTYPPTFSTDEEKLSAIGDLWVDSDDNNKLYRWDGTQWVVVSDTRIDATIEKIDEVAVDVNGVATAKSSLSVDVNNVIAGYVAASDGSTSIFNIYADQFVVSNNSGSLVGAPFVIDTELNKIAFTGNVTFTGTPVETAVQPAEVADAINNNTTTIDGSKITTGTLSAYAINGGVIYNLGGSAEDYTMKIDLNNGLIHIK